ncbi:MAG: SAM-dependent chlorinase/fluorinase [Phycisphaerae bacterium]|nr:SAM-dependent chlorinase/fluorinase [Phycisphaerae bacterium]
MMARTQIATLLTDFGTEGPFVGAMKGVILQTCPRAQIIDIGHDIPPQDLLAGAMVLARAVPHFPPDTVHVVVVDPEVGTDRAILVGRYGDQIVLFPDNGVVSLLERVLPLQEIRICRNLPQSPQFISNTFHGRDVMAPLAGHILNGLNISALGPRPATYKLFELPSPTVEGSRITGQVIYVDRFGNLTTNISGELARQVGGRLVNVTTTCNSKDAGPLVNAYAFVDPDKPLVVFNSSDMIELAVNQGRADEFFKAEAGTPVLMVME